VLVEAQGDFVITPHPRELSRLMGISVEEIQHDRVKAAFDAAVRFNCMVVLKGAYSVIAAPDGQVFINPTGNSGMATAGAGDVLSGIIGGLMAQGLNSFDAAIAGVYLHGKAGDAAVQNQSRPEPPLV
jgi:Predicted sugar kinase